MSVDIESLGITKLSVAQRLELIEQIWDSLPDDVSPEDVPPWHLAEIAKRRAAMDTDKRPGVPWRDVLDRLERRS